MEFGSIKTGIIVEYGVRNPRVLSEFGFTKEGNRGYKISSFKEFGTREKDFIMKQDKHFLRLNVVWFRNGSIQEGKCSF